MSIVHLSDLHLTTGERDSRSEPRLFGPLKGMNAAFRRIIQSRPVQDSNLVLVTGDVTDRGEKQAWQVFWNSRLICARLPWAHLEVEDDSYPIRY